MQVVPHEIRLSTEAPLYSHATMQAYGAHNNSISLIPCHQLMMQPLNILKLPCDHQPSVTIHSCRHDCELQTGAIFHRFRHSHAKKRQCSCVDGRILSQASLVLVIRVLICYGWRFFILVKNKVYNASASQVTYASCPIWLYYGVIIAITITSWWIHLYE